MQGLKTNKQKHLIPEAFDLASVIVLKGLCKAFYYCIWESLVTFPSDLTCGSVRCDLTQPHFSPCGCLVFQVLHSSCLQGWKIITRTKHSLMSKSVSY